MGQYGARALAAAGTPWYRILPKYYTAIRFSKAARGQQIHVLLRHAKSVVVKGDLALDVPKTFLNEVVLHGAGDVD